MQLYRERHEIFRSFARKKQLDKGQLEKFIKVLDTKRFLLASIFMAIKDLVTPKDNFILIVKIAEAYNSRLTDVKQRSLTKKIGTIGIAKKATDIMKGNFVTHASEQVFLSRI